MNEFTLSPIGHFKCDHTDPQLAPRQGTLKAQGEIGFIELLKGKNFEQALEDLNGFDRIWLIYLFDRNDNWKPKVNTPRGDGKKGVFATRAPYRPNQIGISCVKLIQATGLTVEVEDFDLLDNTPILDIKPYINYADSFPDASMGWLESHEGAQFSIEYAPHALEHIEWIGTHGAFNIQAFIDAQLSEDPTNTKRKRVTILNSGLDLYMIAARTWRIEFRINTETNFIFVKEITSGYSPTELYSEEDTYGDKEVHKKFIETFPRPLTL